jgi:hypothetical protein
MNNKNLLRRIENIEDHLGPERPPGELSPEMQAAVDRILRRSPPAKKSQEEQGEENDA